MTWEERWHPLREEWRLATLYGKEIRDFASVLKDVLVRFDNPWQMPFPYVMPLHQAPRDGDDHSGFHFHIEKHERHSRAAWASA